jgi:hypothetical protein
MKAETDDLAADGGEVGGRRPRDSRTRAVGANWRAVGFRERRDGPSLAVQHFNAQLAGRGFDVHEQMPAGETNRPRRQRARRCVAPDALYGRRRRAVVHRDESVAA